MTSACRVIKLGGSLLEWPELPAAFQTWLRHEPRLANVVVVGGGRLVDRVRQADRQQPMSAEQSHWLAIQAMGLNAGLVAAWFADAKLVARLADLRLDDLNTVQIFDSEQLLRGDQGDEALPRGWHVTSDSIAARVARQLDARELVLLKSTSVPLGEPADWSRAGFVDEYFGRASHDLCVRAVNLRQPLPASASIASI